MSNTALTRYVVTFHYQESGLSDILELTSAMTAAGFTTTLADENGHPHELGTNSYGIVSTLDAENLRQQVATAGENALGQKPDVTVMTFEEYLRDTAGHRPATSAPE
ncbi:type V toxin-antitoxin system endoribonuclease antitoxin GhoS [Pantoea vagans]|uniref:type V toxin-antitoxin system endoribonuclease antitoxin GhoS n=1 Tax=Pantoea vagans TaxID=470934 RepID=UPI0023B01110|nr:type V toxin-antitoxin system endoribonuclease antitoxin GhoS [Pantoea vagans]MDE8555187.1 type V toxin-antitoxin system endoribonuclease antitoxin GhoS [Pantoea vagans]MDE8575238.1 type V toxin-antitoxin system endoribonuclease antitoxin GhoS [Pantoea vagans]